MRKAGTWNVATIRMDANSTQSRNGMRSRPSRGGRPCVSSPVAQLFHCSMIGSMVLLVGAQSPT